MKKGESRGSSGGRVSPQPQIISRSGSSNSIGGQKNHQGIKFQKGIFSQIGASPRITAQFTSQIQKQSQAMNSQQRSTGKNYQSAMQRQGMSHQQSTHQLQTESIMPQVMFKSQSTHHLHNPVDQSPHYAHQEQQQIYYHQFPPTNDPYTSNPPFYFAQYHHYPVLTQVASNEPSTHIVEEKENVTRTHQETAPKVDMPSPELPSQPKKADAKKLITMMKKKQQPAITTNKRKTSRQRSKSKEKVKLVEEESKDELRLTQEIGDINSKLEQQRNAANQNYQSRNQQPQHTPYTVQTNQTMEQQSTLCNLASVQTHECENLISLNFDQPIQPTQHIYDKMYQLELQNQNLTNQVNDLKEKHRLEKQQLVERLQQIEENYQKYAFFYTKYLEEKVVMKEREEKEESDKEAIKGQITSLMEILVDVRTKSTYEVQMEIREKVSRMQILQENNLYLQKLMAEPEVPQIQQHHLRSRFQSQGALDYGNQPYSNLYQVNSQKANSESEQKEDRRSHGRVSSSTPKTQHRYQEVVDDEESSQHNYFHHSATKRDKAQQVFGHQPMTLESPTHGQDMSEHIQADERQRFRVTRQDNTNGGVYQQVRQQSPRVTKTNDNKLGVNKKLQYHDDQNRHSSEIQSLQSYNQEVLMQSQRESNANFQQLQLIKNVAPSCPPHFQEAVQEETKQTLADTFSPKIYQEQRARIMQNQITRNSSDNQDHMHQQTNANVVGKHLRKNSSGKSLMKEPEPLVCKTPAIEQTPTTTSSFIKYTIEFINDVQTENSQLSQRGSINPRRKNHDIVQTTQTSMNHMAPLQQQQHVIQIAVALKGYQARPEQHGEQLCFRAGEKIILENSTSNQDTWLYGSIGASRKGWFPSSYVRIEEHIV